jgi:thiamine-phosphate pyrophosphorylase
MTSPLPNLYLITDRHQVHETWTFLELVEELLCSGIGMVQLREKDLSAAELLPLALKMRALTDKYACRLLINDRIDVAQAVAADGVHLGHHSLPVAAARKILGESSLIGVSTHSPEEIVEAHQQGADFVTYGPVFYTPSKVGMGNPVGIELLRTVCHNSPLPVYALGGIKRSNCREIVQTAAHGVAVISALMAVEEPQAAYQHLVEQLA